VNQPLGPFNLILLIPPALAVMVAMRILLGRARIAAADPMHVLLSVSSGVMFVLAIMGVLIGMIGVWILFVPLPLAIVVLILMVVDRTRRSEHRGLVWALAAAGNRGIPLPEAARAFADETPGRTGDRALKLAEALEQGQPLAGAARAARLRMGTSMSLTVRMAEPLGMLGPAMKQQLEDSQQVDLALRDAMGRFFYLGTVIVFMWVVCTFVMLRIVPVFQLMFQEFGLMLPAMTMFIIEVSRWFVKVGWIPILPLTALLIPAFVVVTVLYYAGWLPRGFPLWWRLSKRYDGAIVMRGLALALRRGMPIPQALRLVAQSYPLSIVEARLASAADEVAAGADWCESLRKSGLITGADVAVLSAAQRVGNLDWALEEMAASALRRQAHRVQAVLQVLFPAALLAVGLFVFLFVCGLFLPLIALIQGLT
jgi:type II secretory pathway component PulF